MTTLKDYLKDPGATLDYGVNWSDWLQPHESIASSSWVVTPATIPSEDDPSVLIGLTVLSTAFLVSGIALLWVKGGEPGTYYRLTNTIVTNKTDPITGLPRVSVRSLGITVREM